MCVGGCFSCCVHTITVSTENNFDFRCQSKACDKATRLFLSNQSMSIHRAHFPNAEIFLASFHVAVRTHTLSPSMAFSISSHIRFGWSSLVEFYGNVMIRLSHKAWKLYISTCRRTQKTRPNVYIDVHCAWWHATPCIPYAIWAAQYLNQLILNHEKVVFCYFRWLTKITRKKKTLSRKVESSSFFTTPSTS